MDGELGPFAATAASHPPILTSVVLVCALCPSVASLDHGSEVIDAYLDPSSFFNVEAAVASGSVRLLERVLNSIQRRSAVDPFVRELWVRKGLQAAVRRGDFTMVSLIHHCHPGYLAANALELAAERGDFDLFQWLYEHRSHERENLSAVLIAAAANGCLPILHFLLEVSCVGERPHPVCPSAALRSAVEHGHCDVVAYLTDKGIRAQLTGLDDEVARRGHLEMVKWLHSQNLPGVFTTAAIDAAAGAGYFEIVQFLHENRSEGCRSWAMDGAAKGGFLDIVEFLYANRSEGCTARAVNGAAQKGHLHVLQWLYDHFQYSHRFGRRKQ